MSSWIYLVWGSVLKSCVYTHAAVRRMRRGIAQPFKTLTETKVRYTLGPTKNMHSSALHAVAELRVVRFQLRNQHRKRHFQHRQQLISVWAVRNHCTGTFPRLELEILWTRQRICWVWSLILSWLLANYTEEPYPYPVLMLVCLTYAT